MRIASLATVAALAIAGCADPGQQVLTGQIDPAFPAKITQVKVTTTSVESWNGNALLATAPVAADGTFRIAFTPIKGVRIQLLADNGQSTVVFPRATGGIDSKFTVRGNGAAFDLGMIRYVGDAASMTYAFVPAGTTGGTGGSECNDDGEDANGAMCVDDNDNNQGTCDGDNQDGEQDGQDGEQDGQDGENQDGQDGENQDGENQDGQDGENQDGEQDGETNDDGDQGEDGNDGPDMGDATAEHNFPADGCADEQGQHGHQDEGGGDDGGND